MREMGKLTTKVDMDGRRASIYRNGKLICDIYTDRETGMEYVYLYATENKMRIGVLIIRKYASRLQKRFSTMRMDIYD